MKDVTPAILWASVFVDELAKNGVDRAVIAPGSRSTPLALAFAAHPEIEHFSLLDERGAAFFGLGVGLGRGRPTALVCTSGTAVANFFPAVIEAAHSGVPLLVLTADRPHELRQTGANQSIDQVRIFGGYPRWFQDMPLPEPVPARKTIRFIRTTAARAVAYSLGEQPGPVHINFPFRKPLEPARAFQTEDFPFPAGRISGGPVVDIFPGSTLPESFRMNLPSRTCILAGPMKPGRGKQEAIAAFAEATGFPIIADGLSGLRFGPWIGSVKVFNPQVCKWMEKPDAVLQFGTAPTSQAVLHFLETLPEGTPRIAIQPAGTWEDSHHGLSRLVQGSEKEICRMLIEQNKHMKVDSDWIEGIAQIEKAYWRSVALVGEAEYFEGLILQDVFSQLSNEDIVFVGNSNPVRHLDEFTSPARDSIGVYCNRGASGIDGNIATALGLGKGLEKRVILVLGDLAFYHDLNSLLAVQRLGCQAVIVLIHNDGGGIFRRLPIAGHEPAFSDLFLTPHGLAFEPAAELFGCDFVRAEAGEGFLPALQQALGGDKTIIIECRTDSRAHEAARKRIESSISETIGN